MASLPPRTTDLLSEVIRAEPEFYRDKIRQPEYEFGKGRVFTGNPEKRGAYAPQLEED